jgi:hypothetical protein
MTSRWLLKVYHILNRTFDYAKPQLRSSSLPDHFSGHGRLLFKLPNRKSHCSLHLPIGKNLRSCNDENNVSTFSLLIFDCNESMM